MNAQVQTDLTVTPTLPGTPYAGGFYGGRIKINGAELAIIVAPKAEGETEIEWGNYGKETEATSFFDSVSNTKTMLAAGCAAAIWVTGLTIGGHNDWVIAARDVKEVLYRNLKPTTYENNRMSGDNPTTGTYAYSSHDPAQTACELFQEGGSEAFEEEYYWASTQCSAYDAWSQHFYDGHTTSNDKSAALRARAVRLIPVIQ